jgi:superfamily II DNA or RNA helicase
MFDKNPPKLDVLIVDEAQHDSTTSMAHFHGRSEPKLVIGLSATPWRSDRVGLCFDKIIKDAGIAELIRQGYLSEYHHFSIPVYTPDSVADTFLADPERWGKSVIYFHGEEDCLRVVNRLKSSGISVELVTHRTDRETQLEQFAKGSTQVIVNMMLLTEGFDSPDLRTVFIRPSVKSCTMQMGGRVFRKHASCEFKQIVQCQETETPFLKIAPAQEQFILVAGQWLSLTPSTQIESIINANRALIAKTKTGFVPGMFKRKKALSLKDFKGDDE